MKNVIFQIHKIKFESSVDYKEKIKKIVLPKFNSFKIINKNNINSFINLNKQIFLLLKYFILIIIFFPVFSESYRYTFSEITIKIRGKGIQTIFRNRDCSMPDEIFDIKNNKVLDNNCKNNNDEFCNINAGENESLIRIKWDNKPNSICRELFMGLTNIIEVDLSKFDVSLISMGNLFKNCTSLVYVNLTNVDTTLTTNFGDMFTNCSLLTSLDLSSFKTSKVESINNMFYNCSSLTSLNLSNFDTSTVTNFEYMFYNCNKLTSLNLSNFKFSSLTEDKLISMFVNCSKLSYLNIINFKISSSLNSIISKITENTANNLVICINNEINFLYELYQINNGKTICPILDCSEKFQKNQKKLTEDQNKCVANCKMDEYEYENICYKNCPEGTSPDESKICKPIVRTYIITTEIEIKYTENIKTEYNKIIDNDFFNNNTNEITNEIQRKNNSCSILNFFMNKCKNDFIYEEEKNYFKYDLISSISNGSLSELINQVVNNNTEFIMKDGNVMYQISTVSNQFINENNLTNINFTECETKLRKELGFEDHELVILKIEHSKEGYTIPLIEYAIFLEDGTYLSLEYCDNISSLYYIPVSINENNLFLHNTSSEYYNDECRKYTTENGTDMTMYDRKNDYNVNHLSLCEANCTFKGYNSSTSKAECECKTKSDLYTIDDLLGDDLLDKIENEQKLTNLNLMKCSNLLTSEEIKNNTGFFLIAIIIVLFIIIMIIFCVKGYNDLEEKIDEVISIKFKSEKNTIKKNKSKSLIHEIMPNTNKNTKHQINRKNKKMNSFMSKNSKNNFIKENNKYIRNKDRKPTMAEIENKEIINEIDFMKTTNDYELNNLSYEMALKYVKREFCDYYSSLIRTKQIVFFSFCDFKDYNSGITKKFIFFLSFALHYTISALFFTDKVMHQIYEDGGKYNIIFQFPYITYSAIISTVVLRIILVTLVLTEKSILEVKNQTMRILAIDKKKSVLKCVIIKFIIFSVLNLILLVAFWYYLTCFNALYANTQVDLIINSVISFGLSCLYPFLINIIPAVFRMDSLSSNKNQKMDKNNKKKKTNKNSIKKTSLNNKANQEGEYVYKVSKWLQLL